MKNKVILPNGNQFNVIESWITKLYVFKSFRVPLFEKYGVGGTGLKSAEGSDEFSRVGFLKQTNPETVWFPCSTLLHPND